MRTLMVGKFKGKLLGAIATGLLVLPVASQAALVTVWDTFDSELVGIVGAMKVGGGRFSGVEFVPSASGFFAGFTFGGFQFEGPATWVFTLHSEFEAAPNIIDPPLETMSISVEPLNGSNPPGVYDVTASGATFLTAGTEYWLMARPPRLTEGGWSSIGEGGGIYASCPLPCREFTSFIVSSGRIAGALEVRVETSPVPLPAAAWLLLSGLAGLGVLGRRRKVA